MMTAKEENGESVVQETQRLEHNEPIFFYYYYFTKINPNLEEITSYMEYTRLYQCMHIQIYETCISMKSFIKSLLWK